MAKGTLNEDEYIAELNRRLQAHEDFKPGMAFMEYPPGATGGDITGIATAGLLYSHPYGDVSHSVDGDFDVKLTPRRGFQTQVS